MLRGRNCFILGAAVVSLVVIDGCWVGSNSDPSPPVSFGPTAGSGSSAAGAPSTSAGAPASAGSANTSAGAPATGGSVSAGGSPATAGAPATAGSSAGGTPGTAGAGTAGAAAAGAPAAGGAGSFPPAGCGAPTGTHTTFALDRSCWVATASDCSTSTANPNAPNNALDGSATTRFSTGLKMSAQTKPFTYQVDMSAPAMISGIKVESSVATDAAPQLEVEISTNGTTWTPVACGDGAITTEFSFAPVSARYVRLTQFGTSNTGWWSIHEFNVYSTAANATCATMGAGATATACATPHN